jgi:DNA-binding SARP family transcriptional activator/tetratricopeptide (TPR) repeat protein
VTVTGDEPITFKVLGEVSAWRGGTELDLGPRKQRGVVAMLVLRGGGPVSVTDLVAAVWNESSPHDGPNVVSKYVGRLRRLIGDDTIFDRVDSGYQLRADRVVLDIAEFERRMGRYHEWRRRGELGEAAGEIHQGLALWRGDPLAGVEGAYFDVERARLAERHLNTLEERIDVDLALGRHHQVIDELVALATAHPLRERLAGQLMLALYRCGRQADALAAFRDIASQLADDLGIDPGPDLVRLRDAILRAAADLLVGEPRESAVTVPRQLPAAVADFTGRKAELDSLAELLDSGAEGCARVIALIGPGGVGKTSLAVQLAHRVRERFPDGQLYVQMSQVDVDEAHTRLLRALGVADGAMPVPAERSALYRSLTADRRLLVVLDDVSAESQVLPLIPASARSALLATSRENLAALPAARRLELDTMPHVEGRRLLDQIVGPARTGRESDRADEIVALCGGLPLALRIAGARLTANPHWTVARFAGRLADTRRRLDELRHGDLEVRASLQLSFDGIGTDAAALLVRISLLNVPDFAQWSCAAVLGRRIEDTDDAIDQLLAARLLEPVRHAGFHGMRYRCHDLVRLFAREHAERLLTAAERDEVLDRALGAWLWLAERADSALPHGIFDRPRGPTERHRADLPAEIDPLDWMHEERAAIASLIAQAIDTGRIGCAWELAGAMTAFYEFRSHMADWLSTHTKTLNALRGRGDLLGEGVILRGLAELHTGQDRVAESVECFQLARNLFVQLGNEHAAAVCDAGLGLMYRISGRYSEALAVFASCAVRSVSTGHARAESYALHGSGVVHLERRRLDDAERDFARALRLAGESGFRRGEAQSLRGLALVRVERDDLDGADLFLARSMEICVDLGETNGEANALQLLADVKLRQHKTDGVRPLLTRALEVFEDSGDLFGQALTLRTLGQLCADTGDTGQALRHLDRSVRIWAGLRLPLWHARTLRVLGDVHGRRGEVDLQRRAWATAHRLFDSIGAPEAVATGLLLDAQEPG